MEIIRGKIESAQKIVVYGPEGIGKSTFASKFPGALFIDTEGSTKHLDVARTPMPSSWTMLMQQVEYVRKNPNICQTLIIDSADWAEQLAIRHICADKPNIKGIEDFGYGKGYTYLAEEFGRLLNQLNSIITMGINIVITAHAAIRKFEQPDELAAYDRWELKLQRKTAPMVKEWADMVLFANYQTYVMVDEKTKSKRAAGGKRVMYTTHHPAWDAKNRADLPEELPFEFEAIAHVLPDTSKCITPEITKAEPEPAKKETASVTEKQDQPVPAKSSEGLDHLPKALVDLMRGNNVTEQEIQEVVADKGYYPRGTPITNYDPDFVNGVLIAAWPQVFQMIDDNRVPF